MGLANYRNNNSSTFFNPSRNQDATAIAFKVHDVEHNTEATADRSQTASTPTLLSSTP